MRNLLRNPILGAAAALYLSVGTLSARADDLTIGDPAPPIVVSSFVKGAPMTGVPAGKVSVVEFWATWCGPCKVSIPHLTELAKKYPDVKFTGVSVWENDQSLVAPFVTQMGAKMNYNVAMDSIPAGGKSMDGVMAKTWMQAAGQTGIPTAFIVGKDGKIDWIGHPMEMSEPLAQITSGHWDLAAAAAKMKAQQAAQAKIVALNTDIKAARKTGDPKQVIAILDKSIAADPKMEPALASLKFTTLRASGSDAEAIAYGEHLISAVYTNKDSAESLNEMAWVIVNPEAKVKADAKYAALALKAARKADDLAGQKDPAIADTLAVALFANGDAAGAALAEERAIRVAKGTDEEKDPSLQAHLDEYRKAATSVATAYKKP